MTIRAFVVAVCLGPVACGDDTGSIVDLGRPEEAPQYAQIDCQPDGFVTAEATRQRPAAELRRASGCTVLSGGGDPTNALFGTVTCASAVVSTSCTDGTSGCFADGESFGPPGTEVDVSWTAGDVPAGSSNDIKVPSPLTVIAPPSTMTRGQDYRLELSSASTPVGSVRVLAYAPNGDSHLVIECTTLSTAGELVVPASVTGLLESGTSIDVSISSFGVARRVTAGDYQVDVFVLGDIVGPKSFSIAVE